jgi:NAD(P)-dependent dehydrogenase (short-subunit alcohol dehydrogenase family)
MRSFVTGASGRLGGVIVQTLADRGDEIATTRVGINYLIFAHRYRGEPDFAREMDANLGLVVHDLGATSWAAGDRAVVIIASACAYKPDLTQSLAYNLSKAALNQLARYYAQCSPFRVNTVSPGTFTGPKAVVSKQEVANVVAFLCSHLSSGINGQDVRVG